MIRLQPFALMLALMLPARAVWAQPSPQALYEAGVAAYGKGDLETACPKFRASFEADRQPAPLFMLAKCEEKQGRLAHALDHFEEVLRLGGLESELRDQAARSVTSLGPRVPHVTLVAGQAPANAVVSIDGSAQVISGKPIALEPGEHELRVESPGHQPWTRKFVLKESESLSIALEVGPALDSNDLSDPQKPQQPDTGDNSGYFIGGAVAAGVGVGGFILAAISGGLILDACGGSFGCQDRTSSDPSDGLLASNYVGWALGAAGVGVGTVLFIVGAARGDEDDPPTKSTSWTLFSGPGDVGFGLQRSF